MDSRGLLRVGVILDLLLLAPGIYMAKSAADLAVSMAGTSIAVAVAVLFTALPVFCVWAPLAAHRAIKHNRGRGKIIGLLAAPWIYGLFLIAFLFNF